MNLPLEDAACDVLGKAMRGLGKDAADLEQETGISATDIADQLGGQYDEGTLITMAPALGLHGPSLVALAFGKTYPTAVTQENLITFSSTWDDMTVNAYLVFDPATKVAALFDTGAEATPILDCVTSQGLMVESIFITHTHPDHIAVLGELIPALGNPAVYANEEESVPEARGFKPGEVFSVGQYTVETRLTWGHAHAGTTYYITGTSCPLAIVGDALFARSMGGGKISFADALATNRREIFTLPDETIVASGHGPLTTVGEEKAANPFYPEFK